MFHLCLLMIILGTITVQGARPGNQQDNPMNTHAKRSEYLLVDMKIKTKCSSGLGMTLFLVNNRKISSPSQRLVPELVTTAGKTFIAGSSGNRALAPVHRVKNAAAAPVSEDNWYKFSKYQD